MVLGFDTNPSFSSMEMHDTEILGEKFCLSQLWEEIETYLDIIFQKILVLSYFNPYTVTQSRDMYSNSLTLSFPL